MSQTCLHLKYRSVSVYLRLGNFINKELLRTPTKLHQFVNRNNADVNIHRPSIGTRRRRTKFPTPTRRCRTTTNQFAISTRNKCRTHISIAHSPRQCRRDPNPNSTRRRPLPKLEHLDIARRISRRRLDRNGHRHGSREEITHRPRHVG